MNLVVRGVTFDPQKDFECVARIARAPLVMVMREAMADPEVLKRLQSSLLEPVRETIPEMQTFIAGEVERHAGPLKSVDFKPE
jgi:hypothetical protein